MTSTELLKAKRKIKKLFPQLTNKKFKLWHDSGDNKDTFCIQCYEGKEFYGNEYRIDIIKKTFEFRGNKKTEKRYAIININIEYELPENVRTDEQIQDFVENVEVPKEYVEGSFEFVKVVTE